MSLEVRQHEGHNMGSMGTSSGVPGYFYMQRMFWAVIGSVIGFAALLNLLDHILLWQRKRTLSARPLGFFWSCYATFTAIGREIGAASLPTYYFHWLQLRSPPLGKTILVLSYLTTVIVFCFYKYDTESPRAWENIAYRCGCMAQAQLPLVFLLAGKQNIIGFLAGMGYERLSWLHRWVARVLWLTATFHLIFWFRSWARFNYITVKLSTDRMSQTGFAAWCLLTAVVVFSFAPVRRLSYEVFLILHLLLFSGFIGAILLHVDLGKTYVWICVALFFFDRLIRIIAGVLSNLSFFHPRVPGRHGIWANLGTLTPLPGNVTRITIDKPVLRWTAGQHVFLSCHSVVPFQSHPFSIASLESDKKLEFLVQERNGGTRRFHRLALRSLGLPDRRRSDDAHKRLVGVEGPYGRIRPLRQFDSVCFLAGSTGATFTVPLMRDIVQRWKGYAAGASPIVTRRIRFVWVVKSRDRVQWFQNQLETAMTDVQTLRKSYGRTTLEFELSVYVTCDEELEASRASETCGEAVHGAAETVIASRADFPDDEKRDPTNEKVDMRSLASKNGHEGKFVPKPTGTCCCKVTIDEDGSPSECCCIRPSSSRESADSVKRAAKTTGDSALRYFTGRPQVRSIVRRVLEEAEGESAVVVCGPQGLQDDVRRSVTALSDERAVHKGTGAQGIYLHVEGFCY